MSFGPIGGVSVNISGSGSMSIIAAISCDSAVVSPSTSSGLWSSRSPSIPDEADDGDRTSCKSWKKEKKFSCSWISIQFMVKHMYMVYEVHVDQMSQWHEWRTILYALPHYETSMTTLHSNWHFERTNILSCQQRFLKCIPASTDSMTLLIAYHYKF